jgi:hypothetical protein
LEKSKQSHRKDSQTFKEHKRPAQFIHSFAKEEIRKARKKEKSRNINPGAPGPEPVDAVIKIK